MGGAFDAVEIGRALAAQSAAFAVLLLITSGLHKSSNWPRALRAVTALTGMSRAWRNAALSAALGVEVAAGALLVPSGTRLLGALLAATLWAVYFVLILRAVAGNASVECGCGFGATAAPLGSVHVARNAALLIGALLLLVASAVAPSMLITGTQWLAACALLALYAACDQVIALRPLRVAR